MTLPDSTRRERIPVALLLPDGVGTRNFLVGPFRDAARDHLSISVLSALPDSARGLYERDDAEPIAWERYRDYRDTPELYMLRNVLTYAHMYSIDTFGMRCLRSLPLKGRSKQRVAAEAARIIGRGVATVGGLRWLDDRLARAAAKIPETARYRELFERTRPAVLLSSNQRPTGVLPAVLAAKSLGIPTATCIFSWDNLTSKGRIAAPFDHYLVWGAIMKRELKQFYPHIPDDRIHVVGALQFDPHADRRFLKTREAFCQEIGADPSRPLLCYSSGEPNNSPEDQDHTELVLQLIQSGRIAGRPQLLLRPTPTVEAGRFEGVRRRHPELIYSKPDWVSARNEEWSQSIPRPADVALLTNIAHHCDVNISVASTMTLDFAIHDRPIVNVAFDIANPPPFKYPLWDYYYKFEHYLPVIAAEAALFSRSADDLATHINTYLQDPGLHRENRRRLLTEELGVPVGDASQCIVDTLRRIGSGARAETPAAHSRAEPTVAAAAR